MSSRRSGHWAVAIFIPNNSKREKVVRFSFSHRRRGSVIVSSTGCVMLLCFLCSLYGSLNGCQSSREPSPAIENNVHAKWIVTLTRASGEEHVASTHSLFLDVPVLRLAHGPKRRDPRLLFQQRTADHACQETYRLIAPRARLVR